MNRIIKILPVTDGELFVISAGQRLPLAHFSGRIEIAENTKLVPILGTVQKGTKQIFASFIFCGDLDYQREFDSGLIHSGKVFEALADVKSERLEFAGLRFLDSDPLKNELVFKITDLELIQKLIG